MKTRKTPNAIRFWLPVILVAVWWGTPLFSQEKPKTVLLRQKGGIQFANADVPTPAPLAPALGLKSENTAWLLSLGGTLLPVGMGFASIDYSPDGPEDESIAPSLLILSGAVFGPSLGYFYGGRPGRALTGIGIRVAGTAAMVGAVAASWDNPDASGAGALALVGLGLFVASPIYDIATVKGAVRKHTRTLPDNALTITPAYFAGYRAPGPSDAVQILGGRE